MKHHDIFVHSTCAHKTQTVWNGAHWKNIKKSHARVHRFACRVRHVRQCYHYTAKRLVSSRKSKLLWCFPKSWIAFGQRQIKELWHVSKFCFKDLFHKQNGNLKTSTKNRQGYFWTNWTSDWKYLVSLKTTFLGKSGISHMNSQHYIKNVSDSIYIYIYIYYIYISMYI